MFKTAFFSLRFAYVLYC